jgi:hypothetical protein
MQFRAVLAVSLSCLSCIRSVRCQFCPDLQLFRIGRFEERLERLFDLFTSSTIGHPGSLYDEGMKHVLSVGEELRSIGFESSGALDTL